MPKRDGPPGDDRRQSNMVLLGRIAGAHGVRGEVKINSFTAAPEDIAVYGTLTDDAHRSFNIERLRLIKGTAVSAQLAGITGRTEAEALSGVALYVPRDRLPEPEEDEWYYEDLIGLDAISADGRTIGFVVAVQNFGAGDLLEIRPSDGGPSWFLPFSLASVPVVDVKAGHVVIDPPDIVIAGEQGPVEQDP